MLWFKRKKAIEQPKTEEPQKNVSERLEDALRSEGNSSNTSREALLGYVKETDEKIRHHDNKIMQLMIKKDIGEFEESAHKGLFQECGMTIRFFKHICDFVVAEGLAPQKVQKYISSAKKAFYVLMGVGLLSIASSIYSYNAMRRTLEQNRDLLSLSQTTKNNATQLQDVLKSSSNNYAELSKNYSTVCSEVVRLKVDLERKTSEMQKYALSLSESEASNRQVHIASISNCFTTNFNGLSDAVSNLRKQSSSNAEHNAYNANQISNLLNGMGKISDSYKSLDSRLLGLEKSDYGPRIKAIEDKSDKQGKRIDAQDKKIEHLKGAE